MYDSYSIDSMVPGRDSGRMLEATRLILIKAATVLVLLFCAATPRHHVAFGQDDNDQNSAPENTIDQQIHLSQTYTFKMPFKKD